MRMFEPEPLFRDRRDAGREVARRLDAELDGRRGRRL